MANWFDMPDLGGKVRVGRLARSQRGRIAAWQLNRLEIPKSTVSHWSKTGYLHPVLPTVYAVGHAAPSVEADHAAAVLYAGEGSILSHETGIWWWQLLDRPPSVIHVSTAGRRASHGNVRVHCRRRLERVWHNGLPVTTVAQSLLDYAATAPFNRLRYVLAEAEYRQLLDLDAVRTMAGRGRPGSGKLKLALERHMPQLARTRSEFERAFLPVCEAAGLPLPDVNKHVAGIRVDAVWWEQRVVVELDGGPGHLSRARMVRDRRNDLKLRAAGFVVLRYTWDQLMTEPELIIADLRAALTLPVLSASPGSRSRPRGLAG